MHVKFVKCTTVLIFILTYIPKARNKLHNQRRADTTINLFATLDSSSEDAEYVVYKPEEGRHYSPNIGYVPYWKDGEWVFTTRKFSIGDAKEMCGLRCNRVYKSYGRICGRNTAGETRNFTNYCHLRSYDCDGKLGWKIAYRGNCMHKILPKPPKQMAEYTKRAMSIVSAFYLFNITFDSLDWSTRGKRNLTTPKV